MRRWFPGAASGEVNKSFTTLVASLQAGVNYSTPAQVATLPVRPTQVLRKFPQTFCKRISRPRWDTLGDTLSTLHSTIFRHVFPYTFTAQSVG